MLSSLTNEELKNAIENYNGWYKQKISLASCETLKMSYLKGVYLSQANSYMNKKRECEKILQERLFNKYFKAPNLNFGAFLW